MGDKGISIKYCLQRDKSKPLEEVFATTVITQNFLNLLFSSNHFANKSIISISKALTSISQK